jgi:hypothetical protein
MYEYLDMMYNILYNEYIFFDNHPAINRWRSEEANMAYSEVEMVDEEAKMPYREKTAWLTLIAMAVTFGPYFVIVALGVLPREALPDLRQLGLFGVAAVAYGLIVGIGYLSLRRISPEEAHTPPDERDRVIMRRSTTFAYYVLIFGMIQVGVVMPFTSSGWTIINAALFTIVAAEVVRYGVMVLSYRRQA